MRNPRILGTHAPLEGTPRSPRYRQLLLDVREALFRMKDASLPVSRIAEQLGRYPSTIYRELRRNFFYDEDSYFRGYFPSVAHKLASDRRVPGRKLARNLELASYVIDGLHRCWSPEQIAGRLRFSCQDDLRVSHETIYQYVYGAEGKRQESEPKLGKGHGRHRPAACATWPPQSAANPTASRQTGRACSADQEP